jgi:hypothetical protein
MGAILSGRSSSYDLDGPRELKADNATVRPDVDAIHVTK